MEEPNLYGYVRNSPIASFDPSGLQGTDREQIESALRSQGVDLETQTSSPPEPPLSDEAKINAALKTHGVDPSAPTVFDRLNTAVKAAQEREALEVVGKQVRAQRALEGKPTIGPGTADAGPAGPSPAERLAASTFTGILTPFIVLRYALTGDEEAFYNAQQLNIAATGAFGSVAIAGAVRQNVQDTVNAYARPAKTETLPQPAALPASTPGPSSEPSAAGGAARAIGFADDAVASAYQGMRSGGGHAMRHLIDEGLIPNAGSLASRAEAFQGLTSPILRNPAAAFDWRIGNTAARAFAGQAGGRQVVVFVAKEGPYQGRVLSAIVPDARQIAQWGL